MMPDSSSVETTELHYRCQYLIYQIIFRIWIQHNDKIWLVNVIYLIENIELRDDTIFFSVLIIFDVCASGHYLCSRELCMTNFT